MIGYVAKDKDGEVYLHAEEPTYDYKYEAWFSSIGCIYIKDLFSDFDNMSYRDKPIKVEIKLERI